MENGKSYVRRKIVVIKTLAISKIVFLALLTKIPPPSGQRIRGNTKIFSLGNSTGKIKHETPCKDYKDDGLKNVDISYKIVSLQSSWIRRLYDMTVL